MFIQRKPYEISINTGTGTARIPSIGAYVRELTDEQITEGDYDETDSNLRFLIPYTENTINIIPEDVIRFQEKNYKIQRIVKGSSQIICEATHQRLSKGRIVQ